MALIVEVGLFEDDHILIKNTCISRGLGTKVLKPVERSRRALQNDAIRFVIGQSIFEQ